MSCAVAFFHQNEVSGVQGGIERYLATLLSVGKDEALLVSGGEGAGSGQRFYAPVVGRTKIPRWAGFVLAVWRKAGAVRDFLRKNDARVLEFSRPEYVLFSGLFPGKKVFTIHGTGPDRRDRVAHCVHHFCCFVFLVAADGVQIVGRDASGLPWIVRRLMRKKIQFIDAWFDDCFVPAPLPEASGVFKVFYAGRLDSMKNPALVFAVAEALTANKDYKIEFHYFGGDGAKIPARLAGSVIKDSGLLDASALARAIGGCHLGVLCSAFGEGSPFIVVETLACGRGYVLPPLPGLIGAYKNQIGVAFAQSYSAEDYAAHVVARLEQMASGRLTVEAIAQGVAHRAKAVSVKAILARLRNGKV